MNNIDQWELERQRAWVVLYAACLNAVVDWERNSMQSDEECAAGMADEALFQWQSRFPKPQEKSE